MRTFDQYRTNIYSQFGEDGLLDEIIRRIKPKEKSFCEFGAADGIFCSNTRNLLENGWSGKYMEADHGRSKALIDNIMGKSVQLYFGPVTPANVNDLIPDKISLLSVDVDNDDYNIWKAYNGRPDIVVIEVNSSFAPPKEVVPGQKGASYTSMVQLGKDKGYFLIAHSGNCIFALERYRKLFPEVEGDGLVNAEAYFDPSWL